MLGPAFKAPLSHGHRAEHEEDFQETDLQHRLPRVVVFSSLVRPGTVSERIFLKWRFGGAKFRMQ